MSSHQAIINYQQIHDRYSPPRIYLVVLYRQDSQKHIVGAAESLKDASAISANINTVFQENRAVLNRMDETFNGQAINGSEALTFLAEIQKLANHLTLSTYGITPDILMDYHIRADVCPVLKL